jgi:DNA-binding NarL/FixJ family response regulator
MDIQVAIIEDNHEIRQLMQLIVDGSPGFSCHRAWADCESAVEEILALPPDVLLMDIELPGMSGIEGVSHIRQANDQLNILMLTVREDSESIFDSLCAGATGYLLKGTPPAELLAAIREAHTGGAPMSPAIAMRVVKSFHRSRQENLSARELEILQLLSEGENYSTIAEQLFISKNTVKGHIKNIYRKLHVNTRAEAVLKAREDRLIRRQKG